MKGGVLGPAGVALLLAGLLNGCTPAPRPPEVTLPTLDAAVRDSLNRGHEAVVTSPASGWAWGRYGQLLEAAECLPEARICYARAAELEPGSARWPHLLGLLQLQGEPERGVSNLIRAVALGGATNEASRVRLAQALVERARFAEAELQLTALTQASPGHAAAGLEWARIHFARQKLTEATEALGPCLTNPYTARPALLLLSQVRAREGQTDLAGQLARRATALPRPFDWPDPYQREVQSLRVDSARRAERIQALLAQGRLPEAEAKLAELRTAAPQEAEALLLEGRLRLLRRECAEAETLFRQHLEAGGDSVNGLMQLALALLCQQKWGEAEQALDRVLSLKSDFAQAHANLAVARSRRGNTPGAIASYREALRCSPGDAASHAGLAEELRRSGNLQEARTHLDRALFLDPNQPRAKAMKARWDQE